MLPVFNLGPDKISPVNTLRLIAIVPTAKQPKVALVVTTIDGIRPFVVDLESRPGAAPRAVLRLILALVPSTGLDTLADFGRNVAGRCFVV